MLDLSQLTIISGGQTGVDRAALDFALAHGIRHGGWCPRKLTPGTKLTLKFARELGKPHFMLNLAEKMPWPKFVQGWIETNAIHRLNVAGASEGKRPGIYSDSMRLFERIFLAD